MTSCVMTPTHPVTLDTFADEFLVVCPRCSHKARVQAATASRPARLTCIDCGTSKFLASATKTLGDAADPYFRLPLWLRVPCSAGIVWAFNERHLDYLFEYVSAENRRRPVRAPTDPRNALLESRLPRWMKLATNRAEIVAAIQKLRAQHGGRRE